MRSGVAVTTRARRAARMGQPAALKVRLVVGTCSASEFCVRALLVIVIVLF